MLLRNGPKTYRFTLNKYLLKTGVEDFIEKNLNTDIVSVLLKKSPFKEISPQELAQQLEGKQISQKKFPTLFHTPRILYPKKVHLEQASSEETALYKSSLVSGNTLLDLTGGMGIDSWFFSSCFERVICCEKNEELAQITRHNLTQLGLHHVKVIPGDGLEFLKASSEEFDCIYIDPSRRKGRKRLVSLEEYEPDVVSVLDLLLKNCKTLLIKTSPMLDIDQGLNRLRHVTACHIIAAGNEVKELLWELRPEYAGETWRKTVNIGTAGQTIFDFSMDKERSISIEYHDPMLFLYEPNAAILKSGGFKSVGVQHQLNKLAASSHLYTSDKKVDFPGRCFQIIGVVAFKRSWNKKWALEKANVTQRNFPLAVAEIRKRFKLADGGDEYLFFTTLSKGEKVVIRCKKYYNSIS